MVTTLCPCSKAIAAYGAHNQRGEVTVQIRSRKAVWIEDLIAIIEGSASSELYALLKRQDEKAVTERAYDNPVFVEDLVRNVALKLNAHSDVTWYKVEAENHESIHNHNAYALIEKGWQEERRRNSEKGRTEEEESNEGGDGSADSRRRLPP
jgi:GTP cyclohydrolase I